MPAPRPDPPSGLPPSLVERLARDRPPVAAAILEAAAELFFERGITRVTLREVADRAGVNYGLIHRHFGSKDAIVVALARILTEHGIERVTDRRPWEWPHGEPAISPAQYASLLAWAALAGIDPRLIWPEQLSPRVLEAISDHAVVAEAAQRAGSRQFDGRVVGSVVMLITVFWDLLSPQLAVLAGLDDRAPADVADEVRDLIATLVAALSPTAG